MTVVTNDYITQNNILIRFDLIVDQYLKDNNLFGENGKDYTIIDSGNNNEGIYIEKWNFDIEKPVFTVENIQTHWIKQYKEQKKVEFEKKRDGLSIEPINKFKGVVLEPTNLVTFVQGQEVVDAESVVKKRRFNFVTISLGLNSITGPVQILDHVINNNDDNFYISYACQIIEEDDSQGKGYIKIDKSLASLLKVELIDRNQKLIYYCNKLKLQLLQASSISEIDDITWQYDNS